MFNPEQRTQSKMLSNFFPAIVLAGLCALGFNGGVRSEEYLPVVLWHGMGDSCCYPWSMGKVMSAINRSLPGIHIHSLRIGNNVIQDSENSYFMHPTKQVQLACDLIKGDAKLKNGFNAIGFSQGGQFLRGLLQRCGDVKIKNLISVGGQQQGIYGLPHCFSQDNRMCDYFRQILTHAAYYGWVQNFLAQATYWHDPLNEQLYRERNTFLSDINNELSINETYVQRLQTLEQFVMIKFEKDSMVQPVDTEWFEFYKPGQSKLMQSLNESRVYDRLGLRAMDEAEKLKYLSVDGDHLQFDWDWFDENVVKKYLSDPVV